MTMKIVSSIAHGLNFSPTKKVISMGLSCEPEKDLNVKLSAKKDECGSIEHLMVKL